LGQDLTINQDSNDSATIAERTGLPISKISIDVNLDDLADVDIDITPEELHSLRV